MVPELLQISPIVSVCVSVCLRDFVRRSLPCVVRGAVEDWLTTVESAMRDALKRLIKIELRELVLQDLRPIGRKLALCLLFALAVAALLWGYLTYWAAADGARGGD